MKKLIGYQKGVDLGGWLSQGSLEKSHLDEFIKEPDIERIASWGCDHVRLPIDFENIEHEDGTEKPEGYAYIDSCISWCRKYKLNIILDLHKTCGYIFDDPEYSGDFFDDEGLQNRFVELWKRLAARYAKDSDIAIFEILNEVVRYEVADKWNEIAVRCMKEIRKIAPDAKIMFGGVCNNAVSTVKLLAPPIDDNIIYTFHCYEPLIFTHQGAHWIPGMPRDFRVKYPAEWSDYAAAAEAINWENWDTSGTDVKLPLNKDFFIDLFSEAIKVAEERNVPLYCGEYGVIDQADPQDMLRWFADIHAAFEEYGIGHAVWNYKEKDFGLIDDHCKDILDELIKLL